MRSAKLKQALSVAALAGLTVIALSVVTGTLIESRGPAADQLPQMTLPDPFNAGVVIAEATLPSTSSTSSALSTLAPTTTSVSVLVADSSPPRRFSSVGGRVTQRAPATAGTTLSTTTHLSITQVPAPQTTVRTPIPRPVPTATTVPTTWVTVARTKTTERTTTTLQRSPRTSTTLHESPRTTTTLHESPRTSTTNHVVVPPTVREDDDD